MGIYQLLGHQNTRKRLEEILRVFADEEFGYLLARTKLYRFLPFRHRLKGYVQQQNKIPPEVRLRQAFERLGPTFLKFGQLLSLRPDLVPERYITEFEKMQDHVPPIPFSEVKKVIEEEFHKPLSNIFSSFSKAPLASASIAQVHEARLQGKKVAVKVQRPHIKEAIETDIEIMKQIAILLEHHFPHVQQFHLRKLVHEFERWTIKELNFNIEAFYARKIRENFKGDKAVKIPLIYDLCTGERVLTMEFIEGIPLHDIARLRRRHIDIRRVLRRGFQATMQQMYIDGLFHADPHPGNILVMKNGTIAYVDFGIVGHFDQRMQQDCLQLLEAITSNDPEKIGDTLLGMSVKDTIDEKGLRREVKDLCERLQFSTIQKANVSKELQNILQLIHRYQLQVSEEFILFAKTIITLEGVAMRYDPNFKFIPESRNVLQKFNNYGRAARQVVEKAKNQFSLYQELAASFPETMGEILRKAKKFKLDVEIDDREVRNLTMELERSSGNVAVGLMIAALIVGSSLLLQTPVHALVPFLGFVLAGFLGLWLVHRTIFFKIPRGDYDES